MRERLKRLVVARAPRVLCEDCGETLFRGFAIPWRGGLKLIGAEYALVRSDWSSMNVLVFRHVERERCRSAGKGV
jgi:hypothetical protein